MGALLAIGAFSFFHILINPTSGYRSDTSRTPLFTTLPLLVGFNLVSVALWAWFRFQRAASSGSQHRCLCRSPQRCWFAVGRNGHFVADLHRGWDDRPTCGPLRG